MTKRNFLATIFALSTLAYLAGCGDDSPPAANSAPEFEEETYAFTLAENFASGGEVGMASATDENNDDMTYSIVTTQTELGIGENTGAVTLTSELDFEMTTSYTLQVQVSDGTDSDMADVTVTVTDVNEFMPEFSSDSYDFVISGVEDGDELGKISAMDADGTALLTYSLSGTDADHFAINNTPVGFRRGSIRYSGIGRQPALAHESGYDHGDGDG